MDDECRAYGRIFRFANPSDLFPRLSNISVLNEYYIVLKNLSISATMLRYFSKKAAPVCEGLKRSITATSTCYGR